MQNGAAREVLTGATSLMAAMSLSIAVSATPN
jgi:hypothetical protein